MTENLGSTIVVVDAMTLRRVSIASLLDGWLKKLDVELQVVCFGPGDATASLQGCGLAVLSVGMVSVTEPQGQKWLTELAAAFPNVPLAIISDREDRNEVVAAFRAGARGFLPTSIEPEIAARALSFIMQGGTFFPPAALLVKSCGSCESAAEQSEPREGGIDPTPSGARDPAPASPVAFTPRQQQVLELLRQGRSNKLIARGLTMCEATVKVHVRQIMRKLGASNRTQAALSAMRQEVAPMKDINQTDTVLFAVPPRFHPMGDAGIAAGGFGP